MPHHLKISRLCYRFHGTCLLKFPNVRRQIDEEGKGTQVGIIMMTKVFKRAYVHLHL